MDYRDTNIRNILYKHRSTAMTRGFGRPKCLRVPCFGCNCGMARCYTIIAAEAGQSQVCGSSVFIQ